MDLFSVLQPILFVGFGGIALGSLMNYRRVRTGLPPSWVGTSIQVVSIVIVLLAVLGAILAVAVEAGLGLVAVIVLAVGAAATALVVGNMRTRMRSH